MCVIIICFRKLDASRWTCHTHMAPINMPIKQHDAQHGATLETESIN